MMEPSRGVMGMGGYQTQLHAPSAIFSPHYTRHHHPMYKDSNGFEVSMGMQDRPPDPQFIAEQTFHTPSFGDEEFEIPPITLPSSTTSVAQPSSGNFVQSYVEALEPSHSLGQQMDHVTSTAPTMMHYVPQGVYLRTVNEAGTMLAPATIQFQQQPRMIHHHQQQQQQQQQQHCGVTSTSNLMTISQSQLSTHLGLHFTVPMAVSATSSGGSPPRSNQTSPRQETSEDSDDSAGIAHAVSLMDGWMKRPSPDPPGAKPAAKKSKVPKKKKKRDPNEPQKPVSAYALFFRDTQAAIKGQNPNASFGEVSKIVASMWDSLDDDHKNVYKKKTEAAKKEYLKALAAYRASLVSTSGSAEQADSSSGGVYGSGPAYNPPPHFATVPTTTSHSGGGNNGNGQQLSPLQKKSPLLTSLMEGSQAQAQPPPLQHSPPLMITPIAHMTVNAGMPHQHQQMQGPVPTMATRSPPLGQQQQNQHQMVNQNHGVVYGQNQAMSLAHGEDGGDGARDAGQVSDGSQLCFQSSPPEPNSSGPIRCLRNGCPNQAVDSPDWDSEYCSNECVVSHCRFTPGKVRLQRPSTIMSSQPGPSGVRGRRPPSPPLWKEAPEARRHRGEGDPLDKEPIIGPQRNGDHKVFRQGLRCQAPKDPRTNGTLMDVDWEEPPRAERPVVRVVSMQYGGVPSDPNEAKLRREHIDWKETYNSDVIRQRQYPGTIFLSDCTAKRDREWKPAHLRQEPEPRKIPAEVQFIMPVLDLPDRIKVKVFKQARNLPIAIPEIEPQLLDEYVRMAEDWLNSGVDWEELVGEPWDWQPST